MLGKTRGQFGLPEAVLIQLLGVIAEYPGVRQVQLFGSRAKGNFRPGSDIDLCLDAPALSMSLRLAIENRLDDLLLPWKIDLVVRQEIDSPALLEHIDRVGVTLFSR